MTRQIDAHAHLWSVAHSEYGWLTPALKPLYRDFGPADLAPHLKAHRIDGVVLVQAAPAATETDRLLAVAAAHPWVAGVVGWTDLAAPDAPEAVRRLAARPALLGVRPMLQDLADDAWILRPEVGPGLDAVESAGLAFDALVAPRHLPHLVELVRRRPRLRVVVDHAAKPAIARDGALWSGRGAWRRAMRELAAFPETRCKLSGLATEAGPHWTVDDLRPFVETVFEEFGPRRTIWGSDWPVVNLNGDYGAWRRAAAALCAGLSAADRDAVFGGAAIEAYGLAPAAARAAERRR